MKVNATSTEKSVPANELGAGAVFRFFANEPRMPENEYGVYMLIYTGGITNAQFSGEHLICVRLDGEFAGRTITMQPLMPVYPVRDAELNVII